jgi:hypothetical protein
VPVDTPFATHCALVVWAPDARAQVKVVPRSTSLVWKRN